MENQTDTMAITVNQTTAQPALIQKTFSAVTATRIRDNATSAVEFGLASLYDQLPMIIDDFRLSGLPFNIEPIEQIVLGVMLKGTSSQKTALLKYVPMDCTFYFPDVKKMFSGNIEKWELGKDFITAQIEKLAGFLGCSTPGDVRDVSEKILEAFGGLTPVDFIRFFEYCREGKFRKEYQHISVRGVNAEFLFDWLNDYCEERDTVWLSMVRHVQSKAAERAGLVDGVAMPNEIKQAAAKLASLEHEGHMRRVNFEKELTETVMREIWFKFVEVEHEFEDDRGNVRKKKATAKIVCDPDDSARKEMDVYPYQRDKPGASYKRLLIFVQNFVTLGDDPKPVIDRLINIWRKTHANLSTTDLTWEEYARAESTRFVREGYRILKNVGGPELIRSALSKKNDRPGFEFLEVSRAVMDEVKKHWPNYLEACLEHADGLPLSRDEYEIHQCLSWIRLQGMELPIDYSRAITEAQMDN